MNKQFNYPIGTIFTTRHKHPRTCTVIDQHITTNSNGEIVKRAYVATHEFLGQTVTDHNVPETAIAMGNPQLPQSK